MRTVHPDGLPELFLDRSLGRWQVPALLLDVGLQLQTLAEVYGIPADETVADTEWLAPGRAAGMGRIDEGRPYSLPAGRTRCRPRPPGTGFLPQQRNLRAAEMAQRFIDELDQITEACSQPGPFLYTVSSVGLRRVRLDG
jgi:hypothetical protein